MHLHIFFKCFLLNHWHFNLIAPLQRSMVRMFIVFFEYVVAVQNSIRDRWHPLGSTQFHRCLRPASLDPNTVALSVDFYNWARELSSALVLIRLRFAFAIFHPPLDQCNCWWFLCSSLAYFGSSGLVYRLAAGNSTVRTVVWAESRNGATD